MEKNPGKTVSLTFPLDGPDAASIPDQEWRSLRGDVSLAGHHRYLSGLGGAQVAAAADGD